MSYYVLEVQKVDEEGNVLASDFFVVDGAGTIVDGPFGNIQAAIDRIEQRLEEEMRSRHTPS